MHDPMTLAFSIKNPFVKNVYYTRGGKKNIYRPELIQVWHVDPETDGSDDSCGWSWKKLTKKELKWCKNLIENPNDNIRSFFGSDMDEYDMEWALCKIIQLYKTEKRKWYQHPRWHVWHWKINIIPVSSFKRWAFSRCRVCGKRFKWGESVIGGWDSKGPQWFKSENVCHMSCDDSSIKKAEVQKKLF